MVALVPLERLGGAAVELVRPAACEVRLFELAVDLHGGRAGLVGERAPRVGTESEPVHVLRVGEGQRGEGQRPQQSIGSFGG